MKRLLALALLVCLHASAQTAALMPVPRLQFFDANGVPLAGGLVYTCVAGSSCPGSTLTSYTDSTAGTANTNPVTLDAGGFASIWLGASVYKIVVQTSSGVTISTTDNVAGSLAISSSVLATLAASGGSALVGTLGAGTGAVTRTVQSKVREIVSVKDFGAKGDGATNDTAAFQAAVNALNSNGGGSLFLPYSPTCYEITSVQIASNTTIYSDAQSTCVQVLAGVGVGGAAFTNSAAAAVSNIHYRNFSIDGNQANITGVPAGSGGNSDITLENCSRCSVENMYLKNAAVDGITIACNETGAPIVGDGVRIINTVATLSRRNNLSLICGTNTSIIGGELSFAIGAAAGNIRTGLDAEPDVPGQLISGLTMSGVAVHDNPDGGVLIQAKYDNSPVFNMVNLNVYNNGLSPAGVGVNGAALYAVNYNVPLFADAGIINVVGGNYVSVAGTPASIFVNAWKTFTASGERAYGGVRGIYANAVALSMLGPGYAAGTANDITCDVASTCVLAGVQMGNNNPASFDLGNFQAMITGTATSPYTPNGIALNLTQPSSFISAFSGAGSVLRVGNSNSAGNAGLEIDNDAAAGSWRLFSPGSANGANSGCLSLQNYNGSTFNFGLLNFCPGGGTAIGRNNGTVAATHSLDVRDATATTGITQVFVGDGAAQGTTTELTVQGTTSLGNVLIPAQHSTTGQRFACITTTGQLVSSATACSGT